MPSGREEEFNRVISRILEEASAQGHNLVPVSKKRTAQEQAKLYNIGRGTKGKIVTEKSGKPGDESLHQLGLATDLAFADKRGQPNFAESQPWNLIGDLAKKHGLEWGGDWQDLVDRPHIQMPTEIGPKVPEGLDTTASSPSKPAIAKSKDIKTVIQNMIDAGESEDNIGLVVKEHKRREGEKVAAQKQAKAFANPIINWLNTTKAGGITKSLGGEAPLASLKGLGGFAQGAVLDLPGSIASGLGTLGGLATGSVSPSEVWEGIKAMPGDIKNKTMMAGSDPVAFGRTVGQVTGQPIVGAKIPKIPIKPITRALGKPVELAGSLGKQHGFVTGVLPGFATGRYPKLFEKMIGRGLESVGSKMRNVGKEPPIPKIPSMPADVIDVTPKSKKVSGLLNESKTNRYGKQGITSEEMRDLENLRDVENLKGVENWTKEKKTLSPREQLKAEVERKAKKVAPLPIKEGESISDYLKRSGVESIDTTATDALINRQKPLDWKTDPQRKINQEKVAKAKKAGEFNPESVGFKGKKNPQN